MLPDRDMGLVALDAPRSALAGADHDAPSGSPSNGPSSGWTEGDRDEPVSVAARASGEEDISSRSDLVPTCLVVAA